MVGRDLVFKVKSILHRNDPIICGAPPFAAIETYGAFHLITHAAYLWDELDRQIPGIKGVWMLGQAGPPSMAVVSIKQQYPGHAKQVAALVAGTTGSAYMLKYIIIVDDDIDPSDISEVLWALGLRSDPASIDILRDCWGSQTDPFLSPEKRARMDYTHATAIITACKPYYWTKEFPPTIKTSPELLQKVRQKWQHLF